MIANDKVRLIRAENHYKMGLKCQLFKIITSNMKQNQLNYKVDPSKWEYATTIWLNKVFQSLKKQLHIDIKISRAKKVTENKFKMCAFRVYFGILKQRYVINKNIKEHKKTKPIDIKRKIFNKFKSYYRLGLQKKRDFTCAVIQRTLNL